MTQKYDTSSTDDHGRDDNIFWKYLKFIISLSQRMNPNQAIEEITCKVVGKQMYWPRYNNKMDRIDDIEWKTFLRQTGTPT